MTALSLALVLYATGCCSACCEWCPPGALWLEYDFIPGAEPVLEADVSLFDAAQGGDQAPWSLKRAFAELGVQMTVDLQETDLGAEWVTQDDQPLPKCVTLGALDQQIGCTKSGPSSVDGWYAHGLSVPWKVIQMANGKLECSGDFGMIWLVGAHCDPAKVTEQEVREDFVVFHNNINGPKVRLVTSIHELGHVLNLHHYEYGYDGTANTLDNTGRFGSLSVSHVCEARKARFPASEGYRHVQPGLSGLPWCHLTEKHQSWHGFDCGAERVKVPEKGASLLIKAGKDAYCPGEPVTLEVELKAIQALKYRSDESLDPLCGYLLFWGRMADGVFRPLSIPIYRDCALPREELKDLPAGQSVSRTGIQVWYGTGIDQAESFDLQATYWGFEDPRMAVVSLPITVRVTEEGFPKGFCDAKARMLFNTPQARRFAWEGGGDHLPAGRLALEAISEFRPKSVYAPYANLALTLHWALPFDSISGEDTLRSRAPEPGLAQLYLARAQKQRNLLPPSYGNLLDQMSNFLAVPPGARARTPP